MKQKTRYQPQLVGIRLFFLITYCVFCFFQEAYSHRQHEPLQILQREVKYYVKAYVLLRPIETPVGIGLNDIKKYPPLVMKYQILSNQRKIRKLLKMINQLDIEKKNISGFCQLLEVYKDGKQIHTIGITWDEYIYVDYKSYVPSKEFLMLINDITGL